MTVVVHWSSSSTMPPCPSSSASTRVQKTEGQQTAVPIIRPVQSHPKRFAAWALMASIAQIASSQRLPPRQQLLPQRPHRMDNGQIAIILRFSRTWPNLVEV